MTNANDRKTIRVKSSFGITATWRLGRGKSGKFKAVGLSKAKVGKNPIPLDFVPFEMSNAVMNAPEFNTLAEAENYVRSI